MNGTSPTQKTNTSQNVSSDDLKRIADELIALGEIVVAYARVERAPRMPDGRRETDVEHSLHLGVSATELAARYFPELDAGLVAQFANVHDLPEVYTGDVWTFEISDAERKKKEAAEAEATERLIAELPPYTASLLKRYEQQIEPEARFVRYVDKSMPAVINIVAREASTFMQDHNVTSVETLRKHRTGHAARLQQMFPEFPLMHDIRTAVSEAMEDHYFPKQP